MYALELEHGKYYIGKSDNPIQRIDSHVFGQGSAWTRMFKPIRVMEVIQTDSPYAEDTMTKKYMSRFGEENVRGGSYTSINLPRFSEKLEFRTASDACLRCGRLGHWARDCYASTEIEQDSTTCLRCGRKGHWARDCYAKSRVY